MNRAKQLYELQEMDLEIEHKTGTLAQVTGQLGKDEEVTAAREALNETRKRLAILENEQRASEWGVEELAEKIAVEEKKLYAGSVKNPRELMNLQQEIDLLKEKHKQREEQLLALMMEVDSAQQDVDLKSGEFEATEKGWREDQEHLGSKKSELEAELAALHQRREASAKETEPAILKVYEETRRVRQGLAVAKVVQGRCQGCRMSLPMSDQQKARMGQELATCSNCGRILHME